MHANDIGDIIARFIGSFEITTDAERLRQSYEDFLAARAKETAFKDAEAHATKVPGLAGASPHDPNIVLEPSRFEIEHVRMPSLSLDDIEISIPAFGRSHAVVSQNVDLDSAGAGAGAGRALFQSAIDERIASTPRIPGPPTKVVPPDSEVDYRAGDGSSLVAIRQDTTLLDDDRFSAFDDRLPAGTPDSVAVELDALIEQAQAWSSTPEATNDVAALKATLTGLASGEASVEPDAVEPGEGLAEHAGVYVNGEAGAAAPDLVDILKAHWDAPPEGAGTQGATLDAAAPGEGPSVATVSLGGNLLLNQTTIIEAATYGYTSVVFGDWHETNVIRQLNIVADTDTVVTKGFGSFASGSTQAFNVAHFERMDPSAEAGANVLSAFPRSYTVDVVEGDLFVSNFIRQIHKVGDNDGALFTSVEHGASIVMGDNEVLTFASLSHLTLGYDLVVFGGSVFEGNFIEQINLLLDHDRIGWEGAFADGTSGETGGNLLYNKASILTIGANDGFDDIDPAIGDLVARFDAGDGTIPSSLSSDLTFLGASHLKVLYITGDYIEINAISQLNILSDADTASYVDDLIGELTSDEAVWTVSTGGNILANDATILDADAAGPRQLGGEYYSDSVLIQADLVSDGDDIEVFDTSKLASELVAFTSEDAGDNHDDSAHPHTGAAYDAPGEGVGSILT